MFFLLSAFSFSFLSGVPGISSDHLLHHSQGQKYNLVIFFNKIGNKRNLNLLILKYS